MTDDAGQPVDTALVADIPVVDAPQVDTSDVDIGAAYDRLMVNNGADRGADGKFTSQAGPDAADEGEGGAGEGDGGAVIVATPAPAHLPQTIKAHWDAMPEDARKAWAAHVTETDRKFGEQGKVLGQIKPFHEEMSAALAKYPEFKTLSPAEMAIGAARLAAVQIEMNKNPVGTLLSLAKQYNVDAQLAQIFSGQEAKPADRANADLVQKVTDLEAKLAKVSNPETIRGEISRTMSQKDAETVAKEFAAGKEYWADVEASLPMFIKHVLETSDQDRLMTETLAEAYDMAINANPAVRAKIRAAEAKAQAAQPDPKRTEAARKAASINVKSSANGKDRPVTEEEAMGSAYDRAMAS